ncbi:portal vertex protein [Synechococcus phage ACG-2014d]|uniref:Portal protein n=1 Tax=Synechococcus phage ACG-2014d TaxID=1493509 RepID=A0A0E3F3F9_9CAUD|nr:portal vertex protein [Synechococcus phage ACG-2014d]AIX26176.1 portal vertex protein [Synechococcus phage ACG-2014d]
MSQLFGFSIDRAKKAPKGPSFVQKDNLDGAYPVAGGQHYAHTVDIDGIVRNEYELIGRYRDMILQPECDSAVDDVVNETICGNFDDVPVEIELSNLKVSEKIKKLIREEFTTILKLLDFDNRSYEIFRRWYVDGRLFFHKVIDPKNPRGGLTELRYIDPRKIRKISEMESKPARPATNINEALTQRQAEYFLYNPKGLKNTSAGGQGLKIAPDSITYVHSGIMDLNKNMVLSHLHKAIKAVNQLRMIEDSLVIYRLSRAPERRIFYIDVGNLPKQKAEQYLREVMGRYRNKLVYDASTGEIRDDKKFMSMLEDFWLPRREGGRGTEITTLPGGQNLGELEDVKYFQKKLYKALNVPSSRLETETTFNIGRAAEITRDEVKFQKFIARLRKRFSELFMDLIKTQLVLKEVISIEEWDEYKDHIQINYIADSYFNELKETEIRNERMNLVGTMDPFVGKYFSVDYIRRQVLKHTDTEIAEIDKQIEVEMADGTIVDPAEEAAMAAEGGALPPGEGAPVTEQQPLFSDDELSAEDAKRGQI